jgi:hypothetical protein
LKQAIENRQQAMRKRHEIYLKHKLNTFFDEVPTALSDCSSSVAVGAVSLFIKQ